jgi:diguanylate cyclase (GGDEF)-like protein
LPDTAHRTLPDVAVEQVSHKWQAMLDQASAEFHTFTEALVHTLNLEVGAYRHDLLDVEDLVRSAIARQNPAAIEDAIRELVLLNEHWVERQREVVRVMADKGAATGAYPDLENHLEAVLLEQAPAIERICQELTASGWKGDEEAGARITRALGQLVRLAHELRDVSDESLVTVLVREDRLESVDRTSRTDPLTGLRNRAGVACQLHQWWREDPARERLASVALIDCERLGKLNVSAGTRAADRIIQALAELVAHQLRGDHGLERAFRVNGHQFLLFFGDTERDSATATVERIRQAVAATLFEQ